MVVNGKDVEVHQIMIGEVAAKATPKVTHGSELESQVTYGMTSTMMLKKNWKRLVDED